MPRTSIQAMTAAAALALTACANPGVITTPPTKENTTMVLAPQGDPALAAKWNVKPVKWPLRFKEHNFSARCYDTLECKVIYDYFDHGDPKPAPPASTYGPDYLKGWRGGYLGVRNFPPPAKVIWRSKDGTAHEAEIDIGELFKDEIVRHNVPREEVDDSSDGKYRSIPSILLEVNDRTIRVYMAAMIFTKHLEEPNNPRSDFRYDLILVKTYTY